jgi:hypothetical protein
MNLQKNVLWTNLLISGLLLITLGACSNDEPAVSNIPAVSAASEAAPIPGDTSATTSPTASIVAAAPEKEKDKAPDKSKDKAPDSTVVALAPKPLTASKPLVAGEVKPDKPLPVEDVKAKPVAETPKPALVQGGLSEGQMKTMKTMLEDAKKAADSGTMEDAGKKFDEFFGPWDDAAKELKTKASGKHDAVAAAVKAADEAGKSKDKAKFSKALADLSIAIDKAK